MNENQIAKIILDATFKIHKKLGPGLLESSYVHCLLYEIQQAGLFCECEKVLPLIYENISLTQGYRIDLLVEGKVIIEAKAVSEINVYISHNFLLI